MSAWVGDDVRVGYDPRPVDGDMDVADNELVATCSTFRQEPAPQLVPGFVVGHHPATRTTHQTVDAHVTVDICRQLRRYLTCDEAHTLGMALLWAADLARLDAA